MSPETAESLSAWANGLLVFSLVAGVVATWAIIVSSNVKEAALKRALAEAGAQAELAKADAARANEGAAQAVERAAEANKKAEEERLARMKIEERLAPRSLTGAQQLTIIDKIKPFAPQKFEFISYQEDQEVHGLVRTLVLTLAGAGWTGIPARQMLMGGLVVGILIEFAPEQIDNFGPAANMLADALAAQGISASAAPNEEMATHPDRLRIKVGKKP